MLDLAAVIAQVESSNNSFCIRYEAEMFERWCATKLMPAQSAVVQRIETTNKCNMMTALMIACTSWGKYQLLGESLYGIGMGWTYPIGQFFAVPQSLYFNHFLNQRSINFLLSDIQSDPAKREEFIAAYNGLGAVETYWAKMQDAIKLLEG